jgi:hypothetical protein
MEAKSEKSQPPRARERQEAFTQEVKHTEFRSNSPPIPTLLKKESEKNMAARPRIPTETYERPAPRRQEVVESYEKPPTARKPEYSKPDKSNDSSAVLQQLYEIQQVFF